MVVAEFEAVARHLHWGTEGNHGNLDKYNRCLGPRLEPGTKSIQIGRDTTWAHLLTENHDHYVTESRGCVAAYLYVPLRSLSNGVNAPKNRIDCFFVCSCWRCAFGFSLVELACQTATASCTVHLAGHLLICPQHHVPTVTTYGAQRSYSKQAIVTNTKMILIINQSCSWQFLLLLSIDY